MHKYDVFVARPDGTIWPIAGVYAAKEPLRRAGCRLDVHDAFLQLPAELIASHLEQRPRRQDGARRAAVYVVTEMLSANTVAVEWFQALNAHIGAIRRLLPEWRWCVVGSLSQESQTAAARLFSEADMCLWSGYDALFTPWLAGNTRQPITFGARRYADLVPANGYVWRSRYQMFDMPNCLALCRNCTQHPARCRPQADLRKFAAVPEQCGVELESHSYAHNVQLVGNALSISSSKYDAISNLLMRAAGSAEIHIEENLHLFTAPGNWRAFLARHRFGVCTFTVAGATPKAHASLGFDALHWLDGLAQIRQQIGDTAYLNVVFLAGLPGDRLEDLAEAVERAGEIADCVDVVPAVILQQSTLAAENGYRFGGDTDRWGYLAWETNTLSHAAVAEWCHAWARHRNQNAMYRNYRHPTDLLFANNIGYASAQIRADQTAARSHDADWLARQLQARRHEQIMQYRQRYTRSSPAEIHIDGPYGHPDRSSSHSS